MSFAKSPLPPVNRRASKEVEHNAQLVSSAKHDAGELCWHKKGDDNCGTRVQNSLDKALAAGNFAKGIITAESRSSLSDPFLCKIDALTVQQR